MGSATPLGFGVEVHGEGESVGQRNCPDGSRSSALKFWSAAPLSIMRLADASSTIRARINTWRSTSICRSTIVEACGCVPARSDFYEGLVGFSFPMLFSGVADVREWYDDAARCFRIAVNVPNRVGDRCLGTAAASTSNG